MKPAITLKNIAKSIGVENAAKVISEVGFELLNYTPQSDDELKATMKILEKNNLSVYQTHGPIDRFCGFEGVERDLRAVEYTAQMGAKYMVVHGDKFDFKNLKYSTEASLKYNYDYYAPVVEKAAKLGVKIAFENVFQELGNTPHFCAKAEDLIALIDSFNTEYACACWDTGHAAMQFKAYQTEPMSLVGERIECTHIQDTYMWLEDLHIPPFLGKIDWNDCISTMKAKTKAEVLCLELQPQVVNIPLDLATEYCAFLYKGCLMLDRIPSL